MTAIQKMAGHQHLSTTQRDMHLSPAILEDAIRMLERRSNIEATGDGVETGIGDERNVRSFNQSFDACCLTKLAYSAPPIAATKARRMLSRERNARSRSSG